jgi:hypothetical protein
MNSFESQCFEAKNTVKLHCSRSTRTLFPSSPSETCYAHILKLYATPFTPGAAAVATTRKLICHAEVDWSIPVCSSVDNSPHPRVSDRSLKCYFKRDRQAWSSLGFVIERQVCCITGTCSISLFSQLLMSTTLHRFSYACCTRQEEEIWTLCLVLRAFLSE